MEEREESWLDKVLLWLDERTGIYGHTLRPAPRYAYRLDFWLGSFVLAAFAFEVLPACCSIVLYTGRSLRLNNVPHIPGSLRGPTVQPAQLGCLCHDFSPLDSYDEELRGWGLQKTQGSNVDGGNSTGCPHA